MFYKHCNVVDLLDKNDKTKIVYTGNRNYARFSLSHAIFQALDDDWTFRKFSFPHSQSPGKTQKIDALEGSPRHRENPFIHSGLKVDCT